MVGLEPCRQGYNFYDVSGVARDIPPIEGVRNGTSLNVGITIVGKMPKHFGLGPHNAREVVLNNLLGEVLEDSNLLPDGGQDMSSRTECAKENSNHGDLLVPAFKRREYSLTKQYRCRVATAKRQTSRTSHSDNSNNTLHTLVNGVTGQVDGNFSLKTLPSLDALFKIDEMSDGEFSQA